MHVPEYSLTLSRLVGDCRAVFSIILVGNQIANWGRAALGMVVGPNASRTSNAVGASPANSHRRSRRLGVSLRMCQCQGDASGSALRWWSAGCGLHEPGRMGGRARVVQLQGGRRAVGAGMCASADTPSPGDPARQRRRRPGMVEKGVTLRKSRSRGRDDQLVRDRRGGIHDDLASNHAVYDRGRDAVAAHGLPGDVHQRLPLCTDDVAPL